MHKAKGYTVQISMKGGQKARLQL